jgi:hypothetical protein
LSLLLPLFLFLLSVCSFALLQIPIHLLPIPCSVLSRIIHNKNSFWCRRNIHGIQPLSFKAMSWTASLPFYGHFCLETDFSMHRWKPSMTCFSIHFPCTSFPHHWWIWKGFRRP